MTAPEAVLTDEELDAILAEAAPPPPSPAETFGLEALSDPKRLVSAKMVEGRWLMAVVTSAPVERARGSLLVQAAIDDQQVQRLFDVIACPTVTREDRIYTAWILPVGSGRRVRMWRTRLGVGDEARCIAQVAADGTVSISRPTSVSPRIPEQP